jgi:formiminotetrahydrofolate cyclodeaminase
VFGEQKLSEFMEVLSSSSPTPGGGSASALSGAVGASLVAMVANLTIGKKKYASVEEEMKDVLSKATSLRQKMTDLVSRDAESFDAVMAAFKMAKETEEEKKARKAKIQETTKAATEVPLEVMRKCLSGMELCSQVAEKGNQNSISDAGVAALQFEACADGAMLNVLVNLPGIEDEDFKSRAKGVADGIQKEMESRSARILDLVRSKM